MGCRFFPMTKCVPKNWKWKIIFRNKRLFSSLSTNIACAREHTPLFLWFKVSPFALTLWPAKERGLLPQLDRAAVTGEPTCSERGLQGWSRKTTWPQGGSSVHKRHLGATLRNWLLREVPLSIRLSRGYSIAAIIQKKRKSRELPGEREIREGALLL